MSRTGKTVLWVIVVLIVLYVGWMLLNKSSDDTAALPANEVNSQSTDQGAAMTANPNGSTVASSSDTSDSSINNDTANIDTQMKGLDSDSSASVAGSDAQ